MKVTIYYPAKFCATKAESYENVTQINISPRGYTIIQGSTSNSMTTEDQFEVQITP